MKTLYQRRNMYLWRVEWRPFYYYDEKQLLIFGSGGVAKYKIRDTILVIVFNLLTTLFFWVVFCVWINYGANFHCMRERKKFLSFGRVRENFAPPWFFGHN